MADDQPMWGNNRAVAPTPGAAIIAVDLGDNFTVKGHHLSMIKDRQFDGRAWADPHKHIAEFVEICGIFRYGTTNADAIKLKLFPSSLASDAKVWFNELSPSVIATWEQMRQAFIEALTTKIDSQFKDIKGEMKEMRDGCNSFGGPHPSSECDDKPLGGPKDEEANYAYRGYRGNYYDKNSKNWRDCQSRDENRNSQPREDAPSIPPTPEKKFDESDFEKTMREFMHVNAVFTWSGLTYDPPVNPNSKTTVIHDDSDDEVDEAEKEVESSSSKQTKSDPPPLKAYKPKIPYPQRLRKEKIEERYAKFIDLIKEVRINVPLVDVLAGMPNYGKFLKGLVSNKSKMEQISAAFLNEECFVIVQNKLPPKLGDPRSFLIPCTIAGSVEYLALADLGVSINLMPYSLYASLSGNTLKPIRMSIHLANHTYQYPMGIAENMLVQVGKFMFLADFVILQIEEDDKVPLILG
ncbi:reverse transcriptase domain-containing protein [Tanacetum coccineum]